MPGILLLTLRELLAKKIILGLFLVSTLAWVMLALALNLDVVDGALVGIRIFGQQAGPQNAGDEAVSQMLGLDEFVVGVERFVAGAAYWLALLLGLFATAPLMASWQERGHIDLLLSKPISRTALFGGHVLGVWLTALAMVLYLLGMVWLVISIKTGIWNASFFLSVLVVVGMFAVVYSIIALLTVATGSTALSLIIAYGTIFATLILAGREGIAPQINLPWRNVFLGFYHVLPKFPDVTVTIAQLVGSDAVETWYPFLSSLLFGAVLYILALVWFRRKDF